MILFPTGNFKERKWPIIYRNSQSRRQNIALLPFDGGGDRIKTVCPLLIPPLKGGRFANETFSEKVEIKFSSHQPLHWEDLGFGREFDLLRFE
jgi:hypothetical protein